MTQITLSPEQVQAVNSASDAIELRDEQGTLIGYMLRHVSPERVSAAKRRLNSDGPWQTTKQVLEHLNGLEQG